MAHIARLGSRELFLLAITAIGLGVGYFTHLVGLSFAFGAFVAGMVLSESDFGHQALSDIVPLRDLFGLLFFASVGMLLDPAFLADHLGQVALLVLAVSVCKGLIFSGISRVFNYGNVVPLAVGLGLFQVGEFSFVLARVGTSTGSIGKELYSLVLTTAILTMILTPLVSGQTARLYALKRRWFKHEPLETLNIPDDGLREHVLIVGGGEAGFQIANILKHLGFPLVIVDLDHRRVEQAKALGIPVVYGNASQEIVLEAAGVSSARLLVITTPDMVSARSIVRHTKRLNNYLPVITRTSEAGLLQTCKEMGVQDVVVPEFEAGLEMTRRALLFLKVPLQEIHKQTERLRREIFEAFFEPGDDYKTLAQIRTAEQQFDLQWTHLQKGSILDGKSMAQVDKELVHDVSVVGVIRDGKLETRPDASFRFRPDDLVAIVGTEEARQSFFNITVEEAKDADRNV